MCPSDQSSVLLLTGEEQVYSSAKPGFVTFTFCVNITIYSYSCSQEDFLHADLKRREKQSNHVAVQ